MLFFFAFSVIAPLVLSNPFISFIAFACALIYNLTESGRKGLKSLAFSLAVVAAVSAFNMLFAHYGEDADVCIVEGMMIASSVVWFTAMGVCLNSEKIIYLFRFAPKSALVFSMVLGFIPRFIRKLEDIRNAQIALRGGEQPNGVKEKASVALNNFSALVSYSLESSIITADSMNARGYNPKAVRSGRYKYSYSDIVLLALMFALAGEVLIQKTTGNLSFVFEPKVYYEQLSVPALVAFALFELIPTALNLTENIKWKISSVKA